MQLTNKPYFPQYQAAIGHEIPALIQQFNFTNTPASLIYQTQASAVYSSNIEGNSIDLNSFMNYKLAQDARRPKKELQEIDNLVAAYNFAQSQALTEKALLKAHQMLAKTLVIASLRGKYRNDKVGVFGPSGLVYLAVEAEFVAEQMRLLFEEITGLLNSSLTPEEAFYFAAFVHLRFVHIHPFRDGNGRAARLLEKWFLTQALGANFWQIPSEQYYKNHQPEYYRNISLGVNFYELDYGKSVPFLAMLPNCLR